MYDIRMVKLVTGEVVIGKYDATSDSLSEVASLVLQMVPGQQALHIAILPYGHPFESKFVATIEGKHFLYRYSETAKELQDRYLEILTNLTISPDGLGKLVFGQPHGGPQGSKLIS